MEGGEVKGEKDLASLVDLEDEGMETQAKECRWPLKNGKGKEISCFIEPSEDYNPANTLILAQYDPFQTSDVQEYKITSLCSFKPLNLWQFVRAAIEN